MGTSWEPDDRDECWSDREAWRGDRHADAFDAAASREAGEGGWVWSEVEPESAEDDWPEYLAGPEYWLFKKYGD